MSVPEREISEKAREGKMARTGLVRKVAVRLARMSSCYKREWRSQKRKYKRKRARPKQDLLYLFQSLIRLVYHRRQNSATIMR